MAEMIRETYELTAVSCRLDVRDRQAVVLSQVFRGSEAVDDPVETPLKSLGLDGPFTPSNLKLDELDLRGTALEKQLFSTAVELEPTKPLWLQIGRDAQRLAALPWEAAVAHGSKRTLLRIPNFLLNPFKPRENMRIAICATDPSVAGSQALALSVRELLDTLSLAVGSAGRGTVRTYEVTIFTDTDAYRRLDGSLQKFVTKYANLKIVLRVPYEAMMLNISGSSAIGSTKGTGKGRSTWLQWMKSAYRDTGVDVVHFICPGYFLEESGALVLARSPTENDDTAAPYYLGVKELARFYDRVGCNAMGFTGIGAPLWQVGLRVLAYELSWHRAGPIMLNPHLNGRALANAYGALFKVKEFDLSTNSDLQFCVHPDAMAGLDMFHDRFDPLGGVNSAILNIERSGSVLQGGPTLSAQTLPAPEVFTSDWWAEPSSLDPQREFTQQVLRNERANLSSVRARSDFDGARETGAVRALDFLAELTQKDNEM